MICSGQKQLHDFSQCYFWTCSDESLHILKIRVTFNHFTVFLGDLFYAALTLSLEQRLLPGNMYMENCKPNL